MAVAAPPDPQKGSTAGSSSESSSEEEDGEPEWIEAADRCRAVCGELLEQEAVAVDLEGVDLGRKGEICVVQVADAGGRVFLFDVATLGPSAFCSGLKDLLESEAVAKLFYDSRSDADALFHLHGVRLHHVLDMQVLCAKATRGKLYLQGMAKALAHVLPYAESQRLKGIKFAGQALFAPERGGSYEIWKLRPLPAVLRAYCATDVVHLFTMLARWEGCLTRPALRAISEERMRGRVECLSLESGPHQGRVDFSFPAEGCAEEDCAEQQPPAKRQRQAAPGPAPGQIQPGSAVGSKEPP